LPHPDELVGKIEKQKELLISNVSKIRQLLNQTKSKLYWWGSGSSAVLFLNQLNKDELDKIEVLDGALERNGLVISGTGLTVNFFEKIKKTNIETLIITSSFYKEIQSTLALNDITVEVVEVIY
jgi:hypothetical protein